MIDDEIEQEEGAVIPSAYQSYTAQLSRLDPYPTDQQILYYRRCKAFGGVFCAILWRDIGRLVLFVAHSLRRAGRLPGYDSDDMDIIQEGNLAAGEALKRWDPAQGSLTTFLVPRIRGAILNYAAKEARHYVPSATVDVLDADADADTDSDVATTIDEIVADEAQPTADSMTLQEQVTAAVHAAGLNERELLELYFYTEVPVQDLAKKFGVGTATMYRRINAAVRNIARKLGY